MPRGRLALDAFVLRLTTGTAQAAQSVRAAGSDTNPVDRAPGSIDAGSVQAIIRHFWEQWPNGLAVDAAGTLSIELFPSWSARPYLRETTSTSGLHWLNDMQHVVKEVYLRFGTATPSMGGAFPARQRLGTSDVRRPDYTKYNNNVYTTNLAERFGYSNFGIDYVQKAGPSTAGGWPYSSAAFFLTEDPADYYASEDLLLTENPYGGYSWRRFDGTYGYAPVPGYLAGSGQDAKPRDDQHGWFYHVEEAYFATDNLWIRDWYGFIAQFRRTRVNQRDPFPDMSGRAAGQAISHALQAYRVTGDVALYESVGAYLRDQVAPLTDPVLGGIAPRADYPVEAVFQLGYLARSLISYLEEKPIAQRDPVVLATVAGLVRWNESYGLFGYYTAVDQPNTTSSGTAMTFGDPQGWYAVQGPDPAAMTQLRAYVDTGVGVGGERPYVDLRTWTGDFNGRLSARAFTLLP